MSVEPEEEQFPIRSSANLRHRVWQGLLWTVSGGASIAVLRILTLIVLARLLSPTEFGMLTAALVVVNFSRIFVFLGIGPAVVQIPNITDKHLSAGVAASTLFSFVVQLLVWVSAPAISGFFGAPELTPMLRAISFVFPLRGLCVVPQSMLQRDMAFKTLTKIDVIAYVAGFAPVAIVLAFMGAGAWALILGYIANAVVESILSVLACPPRRFVWWNRGVLSELFRFGSGVTVARLAAYGAQNADNLVVGRFLGLNALGLYGRAYGIMAASVTLTGGIIDKVFFPAIASVQKELGRLQSAFRDGQSAIVLAVLPISGLLVVLAPELVLLILGPKWSAVIPVFQVLAAGLLFRTGYRIAMSMTRGTGAVYRLAGNQIVYSVAVFLGALVGQWWGIQGVAIGVLAAMGVGYVVAARTALNIISLGWVDFALMHRHGALLAATVTAVSWLVASGMRWVDAPAILVVVATFLGSGVILLLGSRQAFKRLSGIDLVRELRGFLAKQVAFVR